MIKLINMVKFLLGIFNSGGKVVIMSIELIVVILIEFNVIFNYKVLCFCEFCWNFWMMKNGLKCEVKFVIFIIMLIKIILIFMFDFLYV